MIFQHWHFNCSLFSMLRLLIFFALLAVLAACHSNGKLAILDKQYPSDYFFLQRAFPSGTINREAYKTALRQAMALREAYAPGRNGAQWQPAGPTNVGGRITSLAVHPLQSSTFYAGAASGGIWKTTDDGLNWMPIFDAAPTLSIGDIALAPSQPEILYAGTGEANAGGGALCYDGLGMFKTADGGTSWQHIGLEDVGSIGKVIVDVQNPNRVFVAAMGFMFENSTERGVFRTTDGGANWEKVLFVNDSTGAVDLAFHPTDPNIVYAATWQRVRKPYRRQYGGPGCGIWRSRNGGDTWEKLANGLPNTNIGRIGLAVSPAQPDLVMAIFVNEAGGYRGTYKSTNKGDTWTAYTGHNISYSSFGWWFGKLVVHPTVPTKVYALGISLHESPNGGQTFASILNDSVHFDQHAFYISPSNPQKWILGNDGGVYLSQNAGVNWVFRGNMPITQFYTGEINSHKPEMLLGGTQDNGTQMSQFGTLNEYKMIYPGDGFYVLVNPFDASNWYAESQNGNLGVSWSSGTAFNSVGSQIGQRKNWNMPVALDPTNGTRAYCGSEKVFRTTNKGANWTAISPDLTNGVNPASNQTYGTITTIDVSPVNGNVIWVGTDDGNVQMSTNGGTTWNKVSAGLPQRWVTRVVADPKDANTGYVTFSGYRYNDYLPHVFKTTDGGLNWADISGNLPEAPANDLVVDPDKPGRLFVATDFGVYQTWDGGEHWEIAAPGMPIVIVTDLDYYAKDHKLLAATFGRSFYTVSTDELSSVSGEPTTPLSLEVMPNPVVENGIVRLSLTREEQVIIALYDIQGKEIVRIFNGKLAAGTHSFPFSHRLNGSYFIRAVSGSFHVAKKISAVR